MKKGTQGPNKRRWLIHCWQCGQEFTASRETAMLCSARCKMARHRAKLAGQEPKRHILAQMYPNRRRYGG